MKKLPSAWLKALSAICANLSAGWYGAVVVFPSFSPIQSRADFWALTYDIIFGTLFLLFTVKIEKRLEEK